jgi:phospholipid/cholesterol/gamma-HCH transport system substrate-binding protein
VLLTLIYLLGARSRLFEARYTLYAEFVDVGGLIEGATVRLAGVQIGRVSAVRLPGRPGEKVRVELKIARRYADRVRRDSLARIDTQGLLGDKIVEITIGSAGEPPVPPGGVLAARDPLNIAQVLSDSSQLVRNVTTITDNLKQTAETLSRSRILEDVAAGVAAARRIAERVEQGPGLAHALVYQGPTTMAKVDRLVASTQAVVDRVDAEVLTNVTALSERLRETVDTVNRSKIVEDLATASAAARRITEQVERGSGWAHALIYDEPAALRTLDGLLASTRALLDRVERGEGAVGALLSSEGAGATRRFLAALDRVARLTEEPAGAEAGLLPTLLFDPKYRAVAEDLRLVARQLREVSGRLATGRSTLGQLLAEQSGEGDLRQITTDLGAALANLRAITEKLNAGEGTLGALLADPTVYENLSAVLDGAQRSFLLRSLLRGLGKRSRDGAPRAEPK